VTSLTPQLREPRQHVEPETAAIVGPASVAQARRPRLHQRAARRAGDRGALEPHALALGLSLKGACDGDRLLLRLLAHAPRPPDTVSVQKPRVVARRDFPWRTQTPLRRPAERAVDVVVTRWKSRDLG
jgi:hypothetical protein